ncbi:MAG: 5'-nucleotidase C-terminal domain-containing protein, partial [Armatimonadota bacterium]|nr:5'-nucleotidase C-terminal domain-containing protein [Armatimonadota bacterium]
IMKKWFGLSVFLMMCVLHLPAQAAAIGKATADFDNERPGKNETAWGRLAADALRSAAKADIALIAAGSLKPGTLKAGPIQAPDVSALLNFGDDDVVTLTITGAQLRAALERAAQAYPDSSPAFLHTAGIHAQFNAQAPINRRITMVRVHGREVSDGDSFVVAMPVSLAEGGAGYFTIWKGQSAKRMGTSLRAAVANFIKARGDVSPDPTPRFAPQ